MTKENKIDVAKILTSYYNYFTSTKETPYHPKKYKYTYPKRLDHIHHRINAQLPYINIIKMMVEREDMIRLHLTLIMTQRLQPSVNNLKEKIQEAVEDVNTLENWKTYLEEEINMLAKFSDNLSLEIIYRLYLRHTISWFTFLFVSKFIYGDVLKNANIKEINEINLIKDKVTYTQKLFYLIEPMFKDDKDFIIENLESIKGNIALRS